MDQHTNMAALLAACLGGGPVAGLRRLTGGASLETWIFQHAGETRILRRRAGNAASVLVDSLPLATEAALLLAAASAGVVVPNLIHLCTPEEGLGEAYIMAYVAGETLGRKIVMGADFAEGRNTLAYQCGSALARIHAIAPDSVPSLATLDAAETLSHYQQIHRSIGGARPVLEAAFQYLSARVPAQVTPQLLHGDFRTGNLMIAPDCAPTPGLVAVLDWELSHLGDPAEDIGWLCVNSWRFGAADFVVGGFGHLHDLLPGYQHAGGTPPPLARIRFWHMLGSLKWAVMCEMMFSAFATGADRSMERAAIGRRVSECEADLLVLMEQGL